MLWQLSLNPLSPRVFTTGDDLSKHFMNLLCLVSWFGDVSICRLLGFLGIFMVDCRWFSPFSSVVSTESKLPPSCPAQSTAGEQVTIQHRCRPSLSRNLNGMYDVFNTDACEIAVKKSNESVHGPHSIRTLRPRSSAMLYPRIWPSFAVQMMQCGSCADTTKCIGFREN
jgi:hypothetical protein